MIQKRDQRYRVYEGSRSGHCCFKWSVVDTIRWDLDGDGKPCWQITVCECFDEEAANLICESLNLNELKDI